MVSMKSKVEMYSGTYKNYAENIYKEIRKETYGEDFGQNSWITIDEYRQFFSFLKLSDDTNVLEIATGSGGPSVFMVKETSCRLTGIELNENGVHNARKLANENGLSEKIKFIQGDASEPLPFSDNSFDVVICIDSINHLKERDKVLQEIRRILKTGGRLLYTDPIVVTGILTNEEIAIRSSVGFFLFVPAGENERLLKDTGFQEIQVKDVTENIASVSKKWFTARERRKEHLLQLEEEKNCNGVQSFLQIAHQLSSQRRLSRVMYTAVK